jgi:hypothetical protein
MMRVPARRADIYTLWATFGRDVSARCGCWPCLFS